ncbi:fructosamine kinase [Xylariaceae sp. FL1651]|nr:fructosamine kinase [Xylariaceae sp. FL1651]
MNSNVDSAIIEALCLDPSTTRIASHGGSGFASTFKLSSTIDGKEVSYFVKTGSGADAELMFKGEHESLNTIHNVVPSLCPRSYAHGPFRDTKNKYFMATDFLDLNSSAPGGSGETLAQKLARLHTTPAPVPEGFDKPMYGFPVQTCCGSSPQDNSWKASWADFYANNRLRTILRDGIRSHGADPELSDAVEKTADKVVSRLLGDDHLKGIQPVVVHGDLWSGNHGRGRIAGQGGVEEVVFDPSCIYGHSEWYVSNPVVPVLRPKNILGLPELTSITVREPLIKEPIYDLYELGIMRMFGGFGGSFWKEYESLVPKSEPREEWEDRLALYEL